MESRAIIILFVLAGGLWALVSIFSFVRKFHWPKGLSVTKYTANGTMVVVTNPPGETSMDRDAVACACARAMSVCFEVWNRVYPNAIAESMIPAFGVFFVSNMDARQERIWGTPVFRSGQPKIDSYLVYAKRILGSPAPVMVVRDTSANSIIGRGKPVIHEAVHALLGDYSRIGTFRIHKHPAWNSVWYRSEKLYVERYGPDSVQRVS